MAKQQSRPSQADGPSEPATQGEPIGELSPKGEAIVGSIAEVKADPILVSRKMSPDKLALLYPYGIPLDFRVKPSEDKSRDEVLVDSLDAFEALERYGFEGSPKESLIVNVTDGEQTVRASIFKRGVEIVAKLHMATAEVIAPVQPVPPDDEPTDWQSRQADLSKFKPPSVRWSDIKGIPAAEAGPPRPLVPGEPPPPGVERPLQ